MKNSKTFNIVISGIGGQGTITLGDLISYSALLQKYDVKNCSLHGLAKRYGSIETHVRFGQKIYSPLVRHAGADLVFGLEPVEGLRACYYASEKTTFLIDTKLVVPTIVHIEKKGYPTVEDIKKQIRNFTDKIITVNASDEAKKITGMAIASNVYMLGIAIAKKLIPIEKKYVLKGIEDTFPEKLIDMNKKVFEAGCKSN